MKLTIKQLLVTAVTASFAFCSHAQLPTPSGMALIPAGAFTMGNSIGEGYITDATPISVNVSSFYMDTNLVSKAQWDAVYTWAISHG